MRQRRRNSKIDWLKRRTPMAFPVLMPKTEYMSLPIPDLSEIKKPPSMTVGIPVPGNPQPMQTFPRQR